MAERRPLTVLQLLPALESGGVERGTLEIAGALVEGGHRSLVMSGGGRLVDPLTRGGSEHFRAAVGRKSPLTLALAPRLARFVREQGVDIVHARSRVPAWIAYLALGAGRRRASARFVTTWHGLYSLGRYSEVMGYGERVIAVSDTVRDFIAERFPRIPASRIRVIHRGVDDAEFPRGHRPEPAWLERWHREQPHLGGRRVLTLPGRLTRLKGHRALFDLLARLADGRHAVHALVAGDPDPRRRAYATALRDEARARGLPVTFLGHREDIREVYAVSDLVLSLSSRPESFGRTVLEALCLGVAVAGYAHGGVGEVLGRMFPDGAVPPGDVDALAETVTRLLDSGARVSEPNAFPLDRMCRETLALYEEVAADGAEGG